MAGKTCMVTGATSGLGRVIAEELARQGAGVVMVGRDKRRTASAVKIIQRRTDNPHVDFLIADLSSQSDIRKLATQFQGRYKRLNVLVNNAGALVMSRQSSVDGVEMTLALNHLAYFLLTNLLLETLQASVPARVVNLASAAHESAHINFNDLELRNGYGGYKAYSRSKLANLLFTYEAARRLTGTGVTVNAVHPGLVATRLGLNNGLLGVVLNLIIRLGGCDVRYGARTPVYLASSPDIQSTSGEYFVNYKPVRSSHASYNRDAALQLWEVSERMTSLHN